MLISAAKSICFSRSSRSQLLLEHAAAAFPGPAARSRPFDPAAVLQNHRIVPAHALAVRCCRCAGRGEEGVGEGGTILIGPSTKGRAAAAARAAAARRTACPQIEINVGLYNITRAIARAAESNDEVHVLAVYYM